MLSNTTLAHNGYIGFEVTHDNAPNRDSEALLDSRAFNLVVSADLGKCLDALSVAVHVVGCTLDVRAHAMVPAVADNVGPSPPFGYATALGISNPSSHGFTASNVYFVNYYYANTWAIGSCSRCDKYAPQGGGFTSKYSAVSWNNSAHAVYWRWDFEGVVFDVDGEACVEAARRT